VLSLLKEFDEMNVRLGSDQFPVDDARKRLASEWTASAAVLPGQGSSRAVGVTGADETDADETDTFSIDAHVNPMHTQATFGAQHSSAFSARQSAFGQLNAAGVITNPAWDSAAASHVPTTARQETRLVPSQSHATA
jgi:hypothetical protein